MPEGMACRSSKEKHLVEDTPHSLGQVTHGRGGASLESHLCLTPGHSATVTLVRDSASASTRHDLPLTLPAKAYRQVRRPFRKINNKRMYLKVATYISRRYCTKKVKFHASHTVVVILVTPVAAYT